HYHTAGQSFIDGIDLLIDAGQQILRIGADQFKHKTAYRFLTVSNERAPLYFRTKFDLRHIFYIYRGAVLIGYDNIADILQSLFARRNPSIAADQVLFAASFDKRSAHISIIVVDGLLYIAEGEPAGNQGIHIHIHLELPDITAQ